MSYRFGFQEEQRLIVVVFEGVVSADEELQAVRDVVADPGMMRDARILVERTRARMSVAPEHVPRQLELIRANLRRFGSPRVATVVAADYDFGMMRMLEGMAASEDPIPHDFMVFRDLAGACAWLGVQPDAIHWP